MPKSVHVQLGVGFRVPLLTGIPTEKSSFLLWARPCLCESGTQSHPLMHHHLASFSMSIPPSVTLKTPSCCCHHSECAHVSTLNHTSTPTELPPSITVTSSQSLCRGRCPHQWWLDISHGCRGCRPMVGIPSYDGCGALGCVVGDPTPLLPLFTLQCSWTSSLSVSGGGLGQ
jgi:hypothetical protein